MTSVEAEPTARPGPGPSPWDLLVSAAWGLLAATAAAPLVMAMTRGGGVEALPWADLVPGEGLSFPFRVLGGLWVAATLVAIGVERARRRPARPDLGRPPDRAALHVSVMIAVPLAWAAALELTGGRLPSWAAPAIALVSSPLAGALLSPWGRGWGFLGGLYVAGASLGILTCLGAVFVVFVAHALFVVLPGGLARALLDASLPAGVLAVPFLSARAVYAEQPQSDSKPTP